MGRLSAPLRDRFGFAGHLEYYTPTELAQVIQRSALVLGLPITDEAALLIGSRSRGTPRVANKLLSRARDYAAVYGDGRVDEAVAKDALEVFGVDAMGLNQMGRSILSTMIDRFQGGPVGLSTLAAALGIAEETLEDAFEPYLLQQRLIERTPRGRVATPLAYTHMERSS
jgi:Holliday junction DNA helicase RuvB